MSEFLRKSNQEEDGFDESCIPINYIRMVKCLRKAKKFLKSVFERKHIHKFRYDWAGIRLVRYCPECGNSFAKSEGQEWKSISKKEFNELSSKYTIVL